MHINIFVPVEYSRGDDTSVGRRRWVGATSCVSGGLTVGQTNANTHNVSGPVE